ncbi:hypothetical protein FSW04_18710 [Baekduia soli]|uniref:Thioredoxin family protein n=1 Tax=Baekduia soli TaxID=496014 RepID=A0A5B8U9V8_9ACTN|nr:hypothetical protein [Baekduia soli]QEC49401.1 hypothetical protein FSW04_18710 [Baekduia soli]
MQIALVAVVLLAGMWFAVLRPKPASGPSAAAAPAAQPTAPGVAGLTRAVDQAKGAAATSDATNGRIQAATGGSASVTTPSTSSATGAKGAATAKPKASVTKATAAKPATSSAASAKAKAKATTTKATTKAATPVDPSTALLAYLAKGKIVVLLFHSDGADDLAARKAVHQLALRDKGVVSAYAPIAKVADYEAITSGVQVSTAPTILVIGKDHKATVLTGYVDAAVVAQAVGDARRADGARKK